MNIFLDTNVILENFIIRKDYATAHHVFERLQQEKHSLFMSVGSFYTMVFLIDKYLRNELGFGEKNVYQLAANHDKYLADDTCGRT